MCNWTGRAVVIPALLIALQVFYRISNSINGAFSETINAYFQGSGKKDSTIAFVIAHPDDESMFFTPLLEFLRDLATAPHHNVKLELLSLTTGNYMGQGHKRISELQEICNKYNINCTVDDEPDRVDGPVEWNLDKVSNRVEQYLRTIKPVLVFTFDQDGVSGHPNHISTHKSVVKAKERCPEIHVWCLKTYGLATKYFPPLAVLRSMFDRYSIIRFSPFDFWARRANHKLVSQLLSEFNYDGYHTVSFILAYPSDETDYMTPLLKVLQDSPLPADQGLRLRALVLSKGNDRENVERVEAELHDICAKYGMECTWIDAFDSDDLTKFVEPLQAVPHIEEFLREHESEVIITFDQDGIDGSLVRVATWAAVAAVKEKNPELVVWVLRSFSTIETLMPVYAIFRYLFNRPACILVGALARSQNVSHYEGKNRWYIWFFSWFNAYSYVNTFELIPNNKNEKCNVIRLTQLVVIGAMEHSIGEWKRNHECHILCELEFSADGLPGAVATSTDVELSDGCFNFGMAIFKLSIIASAPKFNGGIPPDERFAPAPELLPKLSKTLGGDEPGADFFLCVSPNCGPEDLFKPDGSLVEL
ncbi:NAC domain containing protein [Babesia ovis]|uniref:N-acetylglucosaminylphosphatidylinositol deacetylase n=1 Tax=Babesia ovis TaxID=5869 RepID=A0A9W5WTZ8_BABOV|nr:NAC domain containing protein [Babesia ovis]